MSDEIIIRQCAPTLAAIKTGSLFSCPCRNRLELRSEIRLFNQKYVPKGLCLLPLRFWEERALLLLFRPERLQRDLQNEMARRLLKNVGYCSEDYCLCIVTLVRRFREGNDFPHEVGLFLSYPPEDVKGFIENKAEHYKCAGLWKVYGDEQKAKQQFAAFRRCTELYRERWHAGIDFEQLAVSP